MDKDDLNWDAVLEKAGEVSPEFIQRCREVGFRSWAFISFVRPKISQHFEGTPFTEAADALASQMLKYRYSGANTAQSNASDMNEAADALFRAIGDQAKYKAAVEKIAILLQDGLAQAVREKASQKPDQPRRPM